LTLRGSPRSPGCCGLGELREVIDSQRLLDLDHTSDDVFKSVLAEQLVLLVLESASYCKNPQPKTMKRKLDARTNTGAR
jgi:hypothetical protein